MHYFAGCLLVNYPQKHFSLQYLESSHTLSLLHTTLTNKTHMKSLKHIVVNYNFTIFLFGYSVIKPLKQTLDLNMSLGIVAKLTHT